VTNRQHSGSAEGAAGLPSCAIFQVAETASGFGHFPQPPKGLVRLTFSRRRFLTLLTSIVGQPLKQQCNLIELLQPGDVLRGQLRLFLEIVFKREARQILGIHLHSDQMPYRTVLGRWSKLLKHTAVASW